MNDWIRGIAGTFVLVSVTLGYFVHPGFFLFTVFVGANLFQSMFTGTCPMMWFLRKLGLPDLGGAKPHPNQAV
ncbi:MAG TPA: DUF2892 domain-containing protein [Thermoanaerobaculia bacterium]